METRGKRARKRVPRVEQYEVRAANEQALLLEVVFQLPELQTPALASPRRFGYCWETKHVLRENDFVRMFDTREELHRTKTAANAVLKDFWGGAYIPLQMASESFIVRRQPRDALGQSLNALELLLSVEKDRPPLLLSRRNLRSRIKEIGNARYLSWSGNEILMRAPVCARITDECSEEFEKLAACDHRWVSVHAYRLDSWTAIKSLSHDSLTTIDKHS